MQNKGNRRADDRGRLFFVTGAAGGLGRALCAACAARGIDLFITDRRGEPLETLARGLRNAWGVRVSTRACDLSDAAARDRLFAELSENNLRFDGLISVAGSDEEGEFASKDAACLRSALEVNVVSAVEIMNALLNLRRGNARFTLLTVSSLAAFQPMPYKALYAAEKRFLLHLTLALREELSASGVTATALCPAGMPTTPKCVAAIAAQGFAGAVTTLNASRVAERALKCALRGKAVVVPGFLNWAVMRLSAALPDTLTARWVKRQWGRALLRRCGTLRPDAEGERLCAIN